MSKAVLWGIVGQYAYDASMRLERISKIAWEAEHGTIEIPPIIQLKKMCDEAIDDLQRVKTNIELIEERGMR